MIMMIIILTITTIIMIMFMMMIMIMIVVTITIKLYPRAAAGHVPRSSGGRPRDQRRPAASPRAADGPEAE